MSSSEWEETVMRCADEFADVCTVVGGDATGLGNLAQNCLRQFQYILIMASRSKSPDRSKLIEMVRPMSMVVEYAAGSRDKKSLAYNHQSAFAFSIPVCLWFLDESGDPLEYIDECCREASKYHDKIIAKSRGKDEEDSHVNFVKCLKSVEASIRSFVEQYFSNGLVWNEEGEDLGPAVDLRKGTDRILENIQREGVMNYHRAKWVVMGYENDERLELPIEKLNRKQSAYFSKCKNCKIFIKDKVKVVLIDDCSNCIIETEDVISSIEIVNCVSIDLRLNGSVPIVSVEKSNTCQIWIKEGTLEFPQVVTSNIEQVNLQLPHSDPKRDHIETPVPHQFCTKIEKDSDGNYSMSTEAVKHF